jgi:ParB family chromosome partitioning protein
MERRNLMTDIITVPLGKLTAWQGNVRKTGASDGIGELAASIAAHGLLQSLVVKKDKRGKYAVIAGQRRLLALQALAKDGTFAKDYPVSCHLIDGEADGTELSLAENVIRAPMHPADQFEAFRQVIDDGASVADVAARFGVAESTVEKRLRLGRLSPVILTAYREDRIDLEQAMAFTLTDDHDAQERVFAELAGRHIGPRAIRAALTQGEIPASDKRARFIGLEAYEEAGGTIRRDLFDDDNAGYLQDATLLDTLVSERLRGLEPDVKAEGWAWTQVLPDADYNELSHFRKLYPESLPLPDELQAELDRLQTEYDALSESGDDENADEDAIYEKLGQIEERMEEIEDSRPEAWTREQYAVAGVIIRLGRDGMPEFHRGMVRPEDERAAKKAEPAASGNSPAKAKPAFAASLVQELTARRTAALTAELMERPDIGLIAAVHALAGEVIYGQGSNTCLGILASPSYPAASIPKTETDNKALTAIESAKDRWGERLPGDPVDLWSWCLEQDQGVLLDLLAFCIARTVDAIVRKSDPQGPLCLEHAQQLAEALGLDMTSWFTATPENYFMRVSRNQIASAYREARGHDIAPAWLKLKKAELAERVAEAIRDTSWLPLPLRVAGTDDADPEQPAVLPEAAE